MTCLDNATKEQLASLCKEKKIPVLWEEPMKHYTSFQIGGPASAVCIPKNREQLSCLLSFLRKMQINHWFVGNGSNLLISDEGLKGVVILLDSDFDGEILISNTVLEAPAGKKLSSVCAAACRAELTGLEFAWGIPGSVGGAVYMNAGAYGGAMKDRLIWVEYLDLEDVYKRQVYCTVKMMFLHDQSDVVTLSQTGHTRAGEILKKISQACYLQKGLDIAVLTVADNVKWVFFGKQMKNFRHLWIDAARMFPQPWKFLNAASVKNFHSFFLRKVWKSCRSNFSYGFPHKAAHLFERHWLTVGSVAKKNLVPGRKHLFGCIP